LAIDIKKETYNMKKDLLVKSNPVQQAHEKGENYCTVLGVLDHF
jgi:hypothetical protein